MTEDFKIQIVGEPQMTKLKTIKLKVGDRVLSSIEGQEMFIGTVVQMKPKELGVTWCRSDGQEDPYHDRRVASLKRIREGGDILRLLPSA